MQPINDIAAATTKMPTTASRNEVYSGGQKSVPTFNP